MAATVTRGNMILGAITDFKIGAASSEASVGSTGSPLTYRREATFREAGSQQAGGIVKKEEAMCRYFIATAFNEVTLANLRIAFNQASGQLSGSTLTIGSSVLGEQSIVVEGPGPNSSTRTITFPRCVSMATGNVTYDRDAGEQKIEVEFEVLYDPATSKWFSMIN